MEHLPKPAAGSLPLTDAAARQLALWERLHRELQELHAQLEYTKLMLKLGASR